MSDSWGDCRRQFPVDTGASALIHDQFSTVSTYAASAVQAAQNAASEMLDVGFEPIPLPDIDFSSLTYEMFQQPDRPQADFPGITMGTAPSRPVTEDINMDGLDGVERPDWSLPDAPDVSLPQSPQLVTPQKPDAPPAFQQVEMPEYEGGELPPVPELAELQIPDAPDVNWDLYDVERPEFHVPEEYVFDNNYIADTEELEQRLRARYQAWDTDSQTLRARWGEIIQGGTGLPPAIEQAIFDRAVMREDASSEQALEQARGEWAARGFSLPGSTVLAREGEIRRASRVERGRINREVTIQFHEQEIENLRFAVQQGVALEGQRTQLFLQMLESSRAIVGGYYEVERALFQTHVELLRAQIEVYQADITAFREKVQIELSRLEAFRTQLEAERIRGEINQQRVEVYKAQLEGVLANVQVFRAEVEGANAQIQAQVSQMDLYRSRIEAYRSEWEGERVKFDVYNTRVNAEEARTRLYQAQVQAFSERVGAYRSEVEAESTKVNAKTNYNDAIVRQFGVETDAWQTEVNAGIEQLRARVSEYNALIQAYTAEVNSESARVQGESRNAQLAIEHSRANVAAQLKRADQMIQQLQLAESLGLEALKGAAQTNSQLAASALSAVNMTASIQTSASNSVSNASQCSTSYNYSGQI